MVKKAIIISLSGYKLTKTEINIFKKYIPWGVILFKRNIKDFFQLKKLILSIKKITKDKKYPKTRKCHRARNQDSKFNAYQ